MSPLEPQRPREGIAPHPGGDTGGAHRTRGDRTSSDHCNTEEPQGRVGWESRQQLHSQDGGESKMNSKLRGKEMKGRAGEMDVSTWRLGVEKATHRHCERMGRLPGQQVSLRQRLVTKDHLPPPPHPHEFLGTHRWTCRPARQRGEGDPCCPL